RNQQYAPTSTGDAIYGRFNARTPTAARPAAASSSRTWQGGNLQASTSHRRGEIHVTSNHTTRTGGCTSTKIKRPRCSTITHVSTYHEQLYEITRRDDDYDDVGRRVVEENQGCQLVPQETLEEIGLLEFPEEALRESLKEQGHPDMPNVDVALFRNTCVHLLTHLVANGAYLPRNAFSDASSDAHIGDVLLTLVVRLVARNLGATPQIAELTSQRLVFLTTHLLVTPADITPGSKTVRGQKRLR
ncbi:unnamed protein product, partial [Amoebophrya sp. A25]